MRAVPRWRSAMTNSARLTPYDTQPINRTATARAAVGSGDPTHSASRRFTNPAQSPFTEATHVASLKDTRRVRLLSIAHPRHAPSIANAGHNLPKLGEVGQLIITAPDTMAAIPSATRRSKFSRNANHAISVVNTPSAFSSSDAPEAGMLLKPYRRRTGATSPPAAIAPASQGNSLLSSRTRGERRILRYAVSPIPEPR